jgi:hypothetical protein
LDDSALRHGGQPGQRCRLNVPEHRRCLRGRRRHRGVRPVAPTGDLARPRIGMPAFDALAASVLRGEQAGAPGPPTTGSSNCSRPWRREIHRSSGSAPRQATASATRLPSITRPLCCCFKRLSWGSFEVGASEARWRVLSGPSSRPSMAVALPHLQVVRPRFAPGAAPGPAASPADLARYPRPAIIT